jgi:SAM-dependent methyltransferase
MDNNNLQTEDNNNEKAKEINTFQGNIHKLYKLIDKSSCLLWNHNNHITIGKKRQFDSEENFFNIETTQLGYGEISIASMTQLFNFLMNIDTYLSQEDESLVESYNLTKDSYFLDIGSGFGKPVFHCAYQVGCICQGIEVVPARVEFCVDFYFGFSDGRNDLSTEIAVKDNKNKKVYKKKKNGKKKKENQGGIKIIKTYENLRLKKYIDFKELFTNIKFNYDWFNLHALGYSFCMNPDIDDLIWSIQQPKFKYQNYNDNKINPEIYFYLKNNNQDTWVISYLTQLLYEIKQRNILTLTSNEIDYLYDEPFPSIKTKILENTNYMDINKTISNNIVNNLYKSSTNNYIPLIDFNDELSQQTSENTHLLDFLSFVNDITTIDMHDYNNYERLNNITNDNNNNKDKDKDISNDMIIEEELIKKDEEKGNNNNNDMIINFQNEQNSPKNTDILKYLQNLLTFNPHDSEFYKKCSFLCNDATKYSDYHYDPPFDAKKEMKHPFTHIYSYNKLMGDTCKEKICEILNNSDWKVLAWYTNERQTRESGLENFKFVASFPMTSTGNQKFSCYIYIKKYD